MGRVFGLVLVSIFLSVASHVAGRTRLSNRALHGHRRQEAGVMTSKALRVVYASHWGNTARRSPGRIAEGIGPDAPVLATDEADLVAISGVDLLVAGAPVMGLRLPTEGAEQAVAKAAENAGTTRRGPFVAPILAQGAASGPRPGGSL